MSSKYQIFVSSTYIDLKEERDLVIKAILEMGHIPVGMEMFSAADEEQWSIIKRQIDQSDYYVVILANRYGSTTDEGISYTEKEYDYAVSKSIPALGFVIEKGVHWLPEHIDTVPEQISSMNNFKDKVQKKHVSYWKNKEDLYGKCSISLMKAFTAYTREGWIRASQYTDKKLTEELARLSAENAKLREQVNSYNLEEKESHLKEVQKNIKILESNHRKLSVWRENAKGWEELPERATLLQVFKSIAPEMLVEKSIADLSRYAAQAVGKIKLNDLRWEFPVPQNTVKSWLTDFSTLGLVKPSTIKKPVSDKNEYWSLTEKGKELLGVIRRELLESNVKTDEELDGESTI